MMLTWSSLSDRSKLAGFMDDRPGAALGVRRRRQPDRRDRARRGTDRLPLRPGRRADLGVIHVNETTSNINGARWWLHVACTDTLTAYHLHPSRGRAAVTEFRCAARVRWNGCTRRPVGLRRLPDCPPRPRRGAPQPGAGCRRRDPPRPRLARPSRAADAGVQRSPRASQNSRNRSMAAASVGAV